MALTLREIDEFVIADSFFDKKEDESKKENPMTKDQDNAIAKRLKSLSTKRNI